MLMPDWTQEPHASNILHIQERMIRRMFGKNIDKKSTEYEHLLEEAYLDALNHYQEEMVGRES